MKDKKICAPAEMSSIKLLCTDLNKTLFSTKRDNFSIGSLAAAFWVGTINTVFGRKVTLARLGTVETLYMEKSTWWGLFLLFEHLSQPRVNNITTKKC